MKILSYNINKFTQEKLDKVLQHDADVFILPEVACVSKVQLPNGYGMVWTGDIDFKGLGIIWKTGIDADIPEWFNSNHQYFQPLMIEDKLIIGAWPTMTDQNAPKKYPQIAMETLKSFAPYLKEHPTVIAGDMNCFKGQSGESKQYSMEAIYEFLKSMGFVSAYHSKTGEALGKESTATYYHLFKEKSPFFIDYTFSNIEVKGYKLLAWDRLLSDHVAQEIEI